MRRFILIIFIAMSVVSCIQPTAKSDLETKREITKVMIEFQDYLNHNGFTRVFILADEVPFLTLYDEKYFLEAVREQRIDDGTDILEYSTQQVLKSELLTDSYKQKIKLNSEKGLDFSFWKDNATIGSVLTGSEFGLDFIGPLILDNETREDFRISVIAMQRYKNGFAPDPDSIMASYDISPNEVYPHFIELTSETTASYYINYKLIKQFGTAPRFIMDFVYEEGKGWLIDNMYFDDYNGKVLKLYSEYNEY